jgi:hypothetical protein
VSRAGERGESGPLDGARNGSSVPVTGASPRPAWTQSPRRSARRRETNKKQHEPHEQDRNRNKPQQPHPPSRQPRAPSPLHRVDRFPCGLSPHITPANGAGWGSDGRSDEPDSPCWSALRRLPKKAAAYATLGRFPRLQNTQWPRLEIPPRQHHRTLPEPAIRATPPLLPRFRGSTTFRTPHTSSSRCLIWLQPKKPTSEGKVDGARGVRSPSAHVVDPPPAVRARGRSRRRVMTTLRRTFYGLWVVVRCVRTVGGGARSDACGCGDS